MELFNLDAEDISPDMIQSLIHIYENKIIKAKDRYKERLSILQKEYAAENESLEATKESLKKLLNEYTECPKCHGKGYVKIYESDWDSGHNETCSSCKGKGYYK
jgi:DnaJ-class molecular chaperone